MLPILAASADTSRALLAPLLALLAAVASSATSGFPLYDPLPPTGVSFNSSDRALLGLYQHGAGQEAKNGQLFLRQPPMRVIEEGKQYTGAWLETQPMAGAMYAPRSVRLALDNQLVFIRAQRQDGRLPHRVDPCNGGGASSPDPRCLSLRPGWCLTLQGLYMASPAVDVAWFMRMQPGNQAHSYLAELADSLERYDRYLWSTRNDSGCYALFNFTTKTPNCPAAPSAGAADARGLLWAVGTRGGSTGDTGEDHSTKYCREPSRSGPPTNCDTLPGVLSMDMMGYSYDIRRSLARIAALAGDRATEIKWLKSAATVAARATAGLWRPELSAMYDRYADDSWVPTLQHNNLRMMWLGLFTQAQADAFVANNLMNTSRFWTRMPLPSISVDDWHFYDGEGNNWSGAPQGLTVQRAIRALEAYGHHAESVMLGLALTGALLTPACAADGSKCGFPQQINPFTAVPEPGDGYGPMIISLLEYTARRVGVVPVPGGTGGVLLWTGVFEAGKPTTSEYTQLLGESTFMLQSRSDGSSAYAVGIQSVGGRSDVLFNATATGAMMNGVRVVTSESGAVLGLQGVANSSQRVHIAIRGLTNQLVLDVAPNQEFAFNATSASMQLARAVPFVAPHP